MHNIAAYPTSTPYGLTAAPPRGGLLTYLRAGSLTVWMFTLVYRYWYISDWRAIVEQMEMGVDAKAYYYYGFAVALAAHLTLGVSAWFALPFTVTSTWSGRLFTLFCVIELALAPLSDTLKASAMYSLATWAVYALLCLYWESDYRIVQRMTVFAGIVIMIWLFLLLAKHGLTGNFGGIIGGINRNTTATAALAAMVCCLISPNWKIRWAAVAAGIFMAVVVSSRGSMVAMAGFFAAYYFVTKGTVKTAAYAMGALAVVGVALLASPKLQHIVFEKILHLHDQARGIGSGFTGRMSLWQEGMNSFWDKPAFGSGFRSTRGGIHSGYIKILVETGIVGFVIIVGAVFVEFLRRLRLAISFRDVSPAAAPGIDVVETARINAVACGTLAMTLVIWVYEQLYLNLGSMASLVFFLMMAAPAYITTQGVALRR